MKVQPINNQQAFGMKFVNKKAWHKELQRIIKSSELRNEIDKKYPNAEAYYDKFEDWESGTYTSVLSIYLTPQKIFRMNLSSHQKEFPDNYLMKEWNGLTLSEIENKAVEKPEPLIKISINEPNWLRNLYKKLFG